jgi:uncharacterized protein YgiM (DUF1202 family)
MRRFTRLAVSIFVVFMLAIPALAQDAVASVNTGSLNVRTGPSMGYGSIASLPFGFGIQMVARNSEGNWILIRLTNGVTGWVNVNYLFTQYNTNSLPVSNDAVAPTVTPTGRVTGALNLNLRNGASTDNAVIATLPLNEVVVLLGRNYNSTWAQVRRSDGAVGWVDASSLTTTVPVRSLALADGSVFVPFAPGFPGEQTTGTNYQTHLVVPGDSLFKLAQHYGTTMQAIAAANNIYNYDLIYIGQQLIIPA